jgi:phage pi2 protein 07
MTDLKALAYELLHEAQESLQREGHLNPVAVVLVPDENLIFDLEFETDEEREDIYGEMMDVARKRNALAILTVNDVFLSDSGMSAQLQGEGWDAISEAAQEAIVVTASGGGFETWTLICPYFRRDSQFIFQPAKEIPNPGGEVDLLGDWTGKAGAA